MANFIAVTEFSSKQVHVVNADQILYYRTTPGAASITITFASGKDLVVIDSAVRMDILLGGVKN